jgi:hypothetical protein
MIATYVPGAEVRRADGRVYESIPFLATCPKCKHQRAQDWYTRGELLRLLNGHHQDLILEPKTGIATIMPDEFFNVYDKTGPGYSNYKP